MGKGKIESLKPVARKILLLLAAGIALGLNKSPKAHIRFIKDFKKEWDTIDNNSLHRTIKRLHSSKYIDYREGGRGTYKVTLTTKGGNAAQRFKIDEITLPRLPRWDEEWRIITFDIPEKHRSARKSLSRKLKETGFYQLQKSVFTYPFPCTKEVNFIIDFFRVRPYVRIIIAKHIDNSRDLKLHFKL